MRALQTFLGEFRETLTDDLHQRLLEAYSQTPTYEALLAACNAYIEERISDVEEAYSPGVQRVQRDPDH